MELPTEGSTLSTDDVTAETTDDGQRTNTGRAGVDRNGYSNNSTRPTSGVQRINVTPASSDDVTPMKSPEPPEAMNCSWRPMKPGYVADGGGGAVLIERTVEVEDFDHDDDTDNSFHLAIPVMSFSVAVFCAVCNVIAPGLGQLNVTENRPSCVCTLYLITLLFLFISRFKRC